MVAKVPKKSPERQCILSGEVLNKDQLIRFVLSPDGVLTPDIVGKLPGRGIYVKADGPLINEAIRSKKIVKAVARSLKISVTADMLPSDLIKGLVTLLRRRVLDRLGLEQKASRCITGFDKIKAALSKKAHPVMMFHAEDAGQDGRRKITNSVKAYTEKLVPEVTVFSRDELSAALGKDNVVHVLLLKGAALDKLETDLSRLSGLCKTDFEPDEEKE